MERPSTALPEWGRFPPSRWAELAWRPHLNLKLILIFLFILGTGDSDQERAIPQPAINTG